MRIATKTYRLVIFDFDGTLADSFPWFTGVLDQTADRFGFRRVDAAEREALRASSSREILRRFGVPHWKLPMIAAHMRRLKAEAADRIPLFEGTGEMLRRLSEKGVQLGIVSSDAEENVRRTLGPDHAARIIHYECGASLFGKHSKLQQVLRRSGVPAGQAIYVGDEVRDAEAARAAGVAFGAVSWGYAKPEVLEAQRPAEFFASMEAIARSIG